jgi:ParB family transcriptional regulator, chromosome partitioning protein
MERLFKMTDTIMIALDKLDIDPSNARKTRTNAAIEEMAASLKAQGQLQNLVVRLADKKGHYLVTAGGTRWAGFKLLAANGDIRKGHGICCIVRSAEDATEISLAENISRSELHPADAFDAYSKLAGEGKSIADIALRFGKSEHHVKQRLALARVSPVIMQLYRDEEISFDHLQAFTVSNDHAEQERVWNDLTDWQRRRSEDIREVLMNEAIASSDKRVKFIGGIEAYEAAGGPVKRDLFDAENSGYVLDTVKLESMIAEKLQAVAAEVKAEGWANVEILPEYDYDRMAFMQRRWPQTVPLSEEQEAELDRLETELDELESQIESEELAEVEHAEAENRVEAIDARIEELRDRKQAYAPDVIERGTTFVYLDYNGMPCIQRGFVPKAERGDSADNAGGGNGSGTASTGKAGNDNIILYSATLIESLSAQKTAILRAELMNNAHVALASVVHVLLQKMDSGRMRTTQSALKLSLSITEVESRILQSGGSKAYDAAQQRAERISETIPGDPDTLWTWCLEQSTDQLLDLLAFAAAQSVDTVILKHDSNRHAVAHGNQLAQALKIDLTDWYQPTGESCFRHLNRNSIELAVREAAGEQAASAIASAKKKAEAVVIAERLVKGTDWLPEPIRFEQANTPMTADPESIDDIENDDVADDENDFSSEADDFEEAAE